MGRGFDLWLEFEHWGVNASKASKPDFFNAVVTLPTGERYALNVWTFDYLASARQECEKTGEHLGGRYLPAPDLFVMSLDRSHVEEVIADLVASGGLKAEWRALDQGDMSSQM